MACENYMKLKFKSQQIVLMEHRHIHFSVVYLGLQQQN